VEEIMVKLTKNEFKWLEELLLNPINVRLTVDEDKENKKFRSAISTALKISKINYHTGE
jgi:hypothetical protein